MGWTAGLVQQSVGLILCLILRHWLFWHAGKIVWFVCACVCVCGGGGGVASGYLTTGPRCRQAVQLYGQGRPASLRSIQCVCAGTACWQQLSSVHCPSQNQTTWTPSTSPFLRAAPACPSHAVSTLHALRPLGGGAALWAAAYLGTRISAVVVRGGRPDLASAKLPAVTAPTLLLVGSEDTHVLELNNEALQEMGSSDSSQVVVVPGAGHLFEGLGQLERVAELAVEWFKAHMGPEGVE